MAPQKREKLSCFVGMDLISMEGCRLFLGLGSFMEAKEAISSNFFTNPIHNTGIYHLKLYNNKSPKQDIKRGHKHLKSKLFSYERKETLYLGNPGYSARHMSSF
jgi:hypothetical protein